MSDVQSLLQVEDQNVRKWGTQLAALMAPDAPVPDVWFDENREPILPDGVKQMGFITTDGVSDEESLSSETVQMLQTLNPVRRDLSGIENTIQLAFGEDNAYVTALRKGVPFEQFPTSSDGAWWFDSGEITQFPEYRLLILGQDGIGAQARYRVIFAYRVTLIAKEARTMNRSDAETHGVTFGLMRDGKEKKTLSEGQNGPAYEVPAEPNP